MVTTPVSVRLYCTSQLKLHIYFLFIHSFIYLSIYLSFIFVHTYSVEFNYTKES